MEKIVNVEDLAMVAKRLEPLGTRYVFTGGAIVGLLLDHPSLAMGRPTNDVDLIIEVVTRMEYDALEEPLRDLGFKHDISEGVPRCRWILDNIKVDVMPVIDQTREFNVRWFDLALKTASAILIKDINIPIIAAPCFIATKLEAFQDRGKEDFMSSHDIEDIISIVDGRSSLVEEIALAPDGLRRFIAASILRFLGSLRFKDSLPGHLPPDDASQGRMPKLLQTLQRIANL